MYGYLILLYNICLICDFYLLFLKLANYDEAKKNEKKYENSSNLDSTDEEYLGRCKRGQKRPFHHNPSDDQHTENSQSQSLLKYPEVPVTLLNKQVQPVVEQSSSVFRQDQPIQDDEDEIEPTNQPHVKYPKMPIGLGQQGQVDNSLECSLTFTPETTCSAPQHYDVIAEGPQVVFLVTNSFCSLKFFATLKS